jgi:S-adenosylmethionine hydrolase
LALGLREVRRLECEQYFRKPVSQTFHGRDIFAPVAAQLARGVSPAALGPVIESFQALDIPEPRRGGEEICGQVIYVDRFGNLITNIPASLLSGFAKGGLSIRIGQVHSAPLVPAYAAVREGSLLGVVGSWGLLEIAVSRGSAAERLQCGIGTIVRCVGD